MYDFQKGHIGFIRGGRYPHCHSVIIDDNRHVIIDAASDRDKLLSFHREQGVDVLINSHAHEDHLMYNSLFPEAEFWVHSADARAFVDLRYLIDQFEPNPEEVEQWEEYLLKEVNYTARQPDRLLKDGDVLDFGKTRAVVVHTPGHTPGHCCFHFPEERVLFLADLDLVRVGPYYADTDSNLDDIISSLTRLIDFDVDTYLTAHGHGIHEGSPDLIKEYMKTIPKREERLLDFLKKGPGTLEEITDEGIIYGKPKSLGAWALSISERGMMKKHLSRLMLQGKVVQDNDRYLMVT
jgi:glyoxylase-like metal-dependent hydrolase (beta-lactamase superfamily II)